MLLISGVVKLGLSVLMVLMTEQRVSNWSTATFSPQTPC